jgi:hypothetical protein
VKGRGRRQKMADLRVSVCGAQGGISRPDAAKAAPLNRSDRTAENSTDTCRAPQ